MEISVSTKYNEAKVEATLEYDMPETLEELVKKYGEGPVAEAARSSFVIGFQNTARRLMIPAVDKAGKTIREALPTDALQETMKDWMPDTKSVVRLSKFERAAQALIGMSEAERQALLAKVQESLAKAA